MPLPDITTRFWSRVNKDGPTLPGMETPCWLWTGGLTKNGYGCVEVSKKPIRFRTQAHRFAYIISIVDPGPFMVCHHCDNRRCCNPGHMFLGTSADNMRDCREKNRHSHGEGHAAIQRAHVQSGDVHWSRRVPSKVKRGEHAAMAKLTPEAVVEIRYRRERGETLRSIGDSFGVRESTVCMIAQRKTWKHVS